MADRPTGTTPADPILNLDTLVARRYLKIDGEPYELRNVGELSPLILARIAHLLQLVDGLNRKGAQATDAEVAALDTLLGEACREVVVDLAPDTLARLLPLQRSAIVDSFHARSPHGSPTASAPDTQATSRPTGRSRPGASRGSTRAQRRPAGSARPSPLSTRVSPS